MNIMIDAIVLISAALNPGGTPYRAFVKAVSYPHRGLICEQNIDELRRIFNRKFPSKIAALESFLALSLLTLEVLPVPEVVEETESQIRDPMDRPILRAALSAKADILLTGDKDFLDSGLKRPRILTPTEFLNLQ